MRQPPPSIPSPPPSFSFPPPSVILANAGIQRNAALLGSRMRENDGKESEINKVVGIK
jgi:hypothetical protein